MVCCSIRPGLNEYETSFESVTFVLEGSWATTRKKLYVWQTQFGWDGMIQTNSSFFAQLTPIEPENGQFTINVNPDEMYTITTLNTGNKATIPTPVPSQPFPSIYTDNFNNYNVSSEAQYFADQAGLALVCVPEVWLIDGRLV